MEKARLEVLQNRKQRLVKLRDKYDHTLNETRHARIDELNVGIAAIDELLKRDNKKNVVDPLGKKPMLRRKPIAAKEVQKKDKTPFEL